MKTGGQFRAAHREDGSNEPVREHGIFTEVEVGGIPAHHGLSKPTRTFAQRMHGFCRGGGGRFLRRGRWSDEMVIAVFLPRMDGTRVI